MNHALALDIGGTKIAAALVNETGELIQRAQCPTLAHEGAEAVLARAIALGRQVMSAGPGSAPIAAGVGTGGQVDAGDGHIIYATPLLPGWTGLPLRQLLEEAWRLPVQVENDVNAAGLGEATHGAGQEIRHLLCVAVGTGIGGAIILDGRIYHGATGLAGHLGHLSIDALRGRRCNCGGIGCVEMYASGPAIEAAWRRQVGPERTRQWLACEPAEVSVAQIAALAAGAGEGRAKARDLLLGAGKHLGLAIASLLNVLNPELVVVGGGVSQAGEPFLAGIREAVRQRAMPSVRQTPIVAASLGPDAALVGAAVAAFQRIRR